jgi:hypothetical protein
MKQLNYIYHSNMIHSDYNDQVHAQIVLAGEPIKDYLTYQFVMVLEILADSPSPFRYAN